MTPDSAEERSGSVTDERQELERQVERLKTRIDTLERALASRKGSEGGSRRTLTDLRACSMCGAVARRNVPANEGVQCPSCETGVLRPLDSRDARHIP